MHGREIRDDGGVPAPPHRRCKNPDGCRCTETDDSAPRVEDTHHRRLLWIGDAVVSTGFARSTHETLESLRESWDVYVLGVNYRGDPHSYPYQIFPAMKVQGDWSGLRRVGELVTRVRPDVVVVQNDPWNVPAYMKLCGGVQVVASMPVDGLNCQGAGLNGLAGAVFWTEHGLMEARQGGYVGSATVIPLGVDLDVYYPLSRADVRREMNLREACDGFIVGNINRNQPRKRLDLTVSFFAEWVKSYDVRDAYLFLHVAPTGDIGYDVEQLMKYYGLANRLICREPAATFGVTEEALAKRYAAFDVQVTTTQGEGWGLTTMEGMACGIPQIVPDWAALGEWARPAARLVPCSEIAATINNVNVLGGIPDRGEFVKALHEVYSSKETREKMTKDGLDLVSRPEYRWSAIGEKFGRFLDEVRKI